MQYTDVSSCVVKVVRYFSQRSDGPRLKDVEFPVLKRPLDIAREAIMFFNGNDKIRQPQYLGIVEDLFIRFRLFYRDKLVSFCICRTYEGLFFLGNIYLNNSARVFPDYIRVRRDGS